MSDQVFYDRTPQGSGNIGNRNLRAELFKMMDDADNLSPYSIEIEFTQAGPKDLEEVNRAVKDSADYLRSMGFEF